MTRTARSLLILLPLAALFAWACSGSNPDGADAGTDAGLEVDGGTGGADGGADGGSTAGACASMGEACGDGGTCLLGQDNAGAFAPRCFEGGCDPFTQTACGTGNKCAYVQTDAGTARGCVLAGTVAEGEACTVSATTDDCAAGLTCVNVTVEDGGLAPRCMQFCKSSGECTAGKKCYLAIAPVGSQERPLVCHTTCDLFAQDCTTPGTGCYPSAFAPACYPAGDADAGSPCTYSDDCLPGAVCISGTCRALCVTGATANCDTGSCRPVNVAEAPDAGVCL